VPTPRKRKRARPADGSVRRHRAEHPHQVWAMDFQFDATAERVCTCFFTCCFCLRCEPRLLLVVGVS
jgi:hypothetical protein